MHYCLIIPDFRGIGGAQLYALRRSKYLAKKNIKVFFVVGNIDKTLLKNDHSNIPIFIEPKINSFMFDTKNKLSDKISLRFLDYFKGTSDSIIESLDPYGATWGELFAEKVRCKHIIYSLVEPILYKNMQNKPMYNFFNFKNKRNELIGLSSMSIEKIFGRNGFSNNHYVNIPFDDNELSKVTSPDLCKNVDKDSFVIGTVSRLEKAYIPVLIEEVIKFAKNSHKINVFLIVAGDSEIRNTKAHIKEQFLNQSKSLKNLQIMFPGYLNPLGKDFFNSLDVFVGMGTGAVSAISQACATIVVDPTLCLSSGIFGIETNNFAYSENDAQFTIFDSLTSLFSDKGKLEKAKLSGYKLYKKSFTLTRCMEKLDKYIDSSEKGMSYWNFNIYSVKIIHAIYKSRNNGLILIINKFRKILMSRLYA